MHTVIILNVIMLNVIILNVNMPSVLAPLTRLNHSLWVKNFYPARGLPMMVLNLNTERASLSNTRTAVKVYLKAALSGRTNQNVQHEVSFAFKNKNRILGLNRRQKAKNKRTRGP